MTVGGNATIRCFIDVMNSSTLSVAGDITHKGDTAWCCRP